jgi:integrase
MKIITLQDILRGNSRTACLAGSDLEGFFYGVAMAVKLKERPEGSGIWWIFINHHGRRKAKKIGNYKLARQIAEKLKAKLMLNDMGFLQDRQRAIFKTYADKWQATVLPATCKHSTIKDYEFILKKHVLPVLGDKCVIDISRGMVKQLLLKKVAQGYSSSTVIHIKNVISGILNIAIDDEVISINPAHRLGKLYVVQDRKLKIEPLTKDEVKTLLDTFKENYPLYYPITLTLVRTGLRLGEGLGLQWGDVDFKSSFFMVRRNISRNRIETPKSGKSRRVDISNQLLANLQELNHTRDIIRLKQGEKSKWIFLNQNGARLESWRFQRVFNAALTKAGLRKIRVHDLRHFYASSLIQNGESLAYIKEQLGHYSIKMTVDIYGHLVPGANKKAVDRLDDEDFIMQPDATYTQPERKRG